MSDRAGTAVENHRIAELIRRFREIGETSMRDLPLYNAALEVEALGFRQMDGHWVGVLITPWFMNLLRLPEEPVAMDLAAIGRKRTIALPSGERDLIQGGDEMIGAYESLSLHSPMFAFQSQHAARQEAERRLIDLLQASQESSPQENGRLRADDELPKMSRRAFLRGTASEV